VTRALKTLWDVNKFECRTVILGVSNQQVVVRDLTLPNLPPDQMAKALPFQARDVVPIPLDQALLDFAPLGAPDPASDTVSGLLVAAPRQPVSYAVQAVEGAGLKVARVDLASFALLRSIADDGVAVEAVIDIGAHLTTIVIHNQGIPKVVRSVTRAANEWTDMLVSKGGMQDEEAENAKRMVGLTDADPGIRTMIGQAIRPLMAEIRSSIQYFEATNPGVHLEKVSLSGGGSQLPGIGPSFSDQLGVPTELATPMRHFRNRYNSKGESNDAAATAVSVGLAIGAVA
jgi:type IV pilus assembly protein PilM